ncbi:MAG: hypothetical protein ABSD20_11875 [Terriglobales bacterium]
MTKTLTINGRTFTLAPMTFGEGREIFTPGADPFEANCQMVAVCLNRGMATGGTATGGTAAPGSAVHTVDTVKDLEFPVAQALVMACLEINGLRETAPGEASAGEAARTTAGGAPALQRAAG